MGLDSHRLLFFSFLDLSRVKYTSQGFRGLCYVRLLVIFHFFSSSKDTLFLFIFNLVAHTLAIFSSSKS